MRQTIPQTFIYIAFGVMPFLWNMHDYFLPISWFAIPIMIHKTVKAVSQGRTKQRRDTNLGEGSNKGSNNEPSESGKSSTAATGASNKRASGVADTGGAIVVAAE